MSILEKGLVQVYTGDGKGKTTAALGIATRMIDHGGNVFICFFLKKPTAPRFCLSKENCTYEELP